MNKKVTLSIVFVLIVFISPFIASSSGYPNNIDRKPIKANYDRGVFPFWYLCHVNTSGFGYPVHSGNNMFIAITYDEDCNYVNTTIRSFFKSVTINTSHNIQFFFFIGDVTLPPSGMDGEISLNGMALMANIWE